MSRRASVKPFVIAMLVACAVVGIALFVISRARSEDTGERAVAAMKALNDADEVFPEKISGAMARLQGPLILSQPVGAADAMRTELIPLLDEYVAIFEAAVKAGNAYLAERPDKDTQ